MIIKKIIITFNSTVDVLENPIWHVHEGKIPNCTYPLEFSTLINLVTALNTSDISTIYNFCLLYIKKKLIWRRKKI